MMTNNNYFKQIFFSLSGTGGGGGDKMIAPQMNTCDKISCIWSFKKHVKTPARSEK